MQEILITGAVAAIGGLVLGGVVAAWLVDRKFRRRLEGVRAEVQRLTAVAEKKLGGDDPDLDDLLENLRSSMTDAEGALRAMRDQAEITKRKSEASRELILTSRHIIRMIDDGDDEPLDERQIAASAKKRTPKVAAPAGNNETDKASPKTKKIILR